jgi:type III secretion system YscQ/HrcQ family protein
MIARKCELDLDNPRPPGQQRTPMAIVEPLTLARLPRVSGVRATALWGARDRVLVCELTGVGRLSLTWIGVDGVELPSVETFGLCDRDGRPGRIAIDRWLALAVVAATLGLPPPLALRRLGPVERGVLGGHLAALLARWASSIAVDLAPSQPSAARLIPVTLRAETGGASGMVRIEAAPEWFAPAATERPLNAAAVRLHTVASVELATTTLSFAELEGAGVGDAVVFDGAAGVAEPDRLVEVRVGDHAAPARLRDGRLVLAAGFRAMDPRARPAVVRRTNAMSDHPDQPTNAALLAAAPIELVAELGRIVLRGDEVLALGEGSVLSLGRAGTAVDLVVGGRTWARGELVNVDGELGVRITELAR